MILFAILIPTVIVPYATYKKVGRPVAVVRLSNGVTLEFEIFLEDVPIASANFLYLAKRGYFNGSIIFDVQNDFVRFGGFYNNQFDHRTNDTEFTNKFTDIVPDSATHNRFSYRLRADTGAQTQHGLENGYLSFMQNAYATEFQICAGTDALLNVTNENGSSMITEPIISFGRYLNEDTLKKIEALYAGTAGKTSATTDRIGWQTPNVQIKITGVKIYNLSKGDWKKPDFSKLVLPNVSYWTNG
jgi:cyclophilin family peptidyl-prolyl cis-trans isomerase